MKPKGRAAPAEMASTAGQKRPTFIAVEGPIGVGKTTLVNRLSEHFPARMLLEVVEKEPENRKAWVQLGHDYFDTNQFVQAVEAYDKALAMDRNDPNVLTDQGVMFRKLGWYDRAGSNFEEANKINSFHTQSLYNLGIVYRYDLNDFGKAIEAWERFLSIAPPGPSVDQIRAEIEFMKSHPPTGGNK